MAEAFFLMFVVGCPMARSARPVAHRRFPRFHRHVQDPQVTWVQKAGAWSALAASMLVVFLYGTAADVEELREQYVIRLAFTPWLLLLAAPLVVLVLYRIGAAGRSTLWFVGATTAILLLFVGAVLLGPWLQDADLPALVRLRA